MPSQMSPAEEHRRMTAIKPSAEEVEAHRALVVAVARIARRTVPSHGPGGELSWAMALIEADEIVPQYLKRAYQSAIIIPNTSPGPGWFTPADIDAVWYGWSAQEFLSQGVRGSAWYNQRSVENFIHQVALAQRQAGDAGADESRLRARAEAAVRRRGRR